MKGFRWRLELVLRLRGFDLERARRDLARARIQEAVLRRRADEASARTEQATLALDGRLHAGLPAWILPPATAHVGVARATAAIASRQAERARVGAASARETVVRAWGRVRALERLRQEARAEYERELARREQNETEELARCRSGRAGGDA